MHLWATDGGALLSEDIIIRKIPLPLRVRAFTIPDADGDYNIYINSNLSEEQQKKSLAHEKSHIENEDFMKSKSASEIEELARKRLISK